ncbi:GPW/gp25 family protein [Tundrisphaera lichenicola]|uniref:GPW/gp25 family protein n=1 Tax=Tundrisphaera lichenicola TaxID=2029860 RepID=UPI003EB6E65A
MNTSRYFAQPFRIDFRGRAAEEEADGHVRDLIEAVLFTSPGERVNLPEFGCGLRRLLFSPNFELLATATEAVAAAALDRWLSDWIVVDRLEITNEDSTLHVRLDYFRRDTREPVRVEFTRS